MTIYWTKAPVTGRLGVAARPRGGDWLADEIRNWKAEGVDLVLSLLTPDEMRELALGAEEPVCRENGIAFRSFPIPDRGIPLLPAAAHDLVVELARVLATGKRIVIHCRQGIGRSGLVAAAILIELGSSPEAAIADVAAVRGRPVPDTPEQLAWVLAQPKT